VTRAGWEEIRMHKGWRDEALYGSRKGQRSFRLNRQWRVIYTINKDGVIEFIEIIEVMPHEY